MIIESKFNFKQEVFSISQYCKEEFVDCVDCDATGYVLTNKGISFTCPICHGNAGKTVWNSKQWNVSNSGKVGKITTESYDKEYNRDSSVTYMLDSSGVGSGTYYYEDTLFASKEEAQQECDKRNLKLK